MLFDKSEIKGKNFDLASFCEIVQNKIHYELEETSENYTKHNFNQVGQGICEALMDSI